jgi:hypothetical protein
MYGSSATTRRRWGKSVGGSGERRLGSLPDYYEAFVGEKLPADRARGSPV